MITKEVIKNAEIVNKIEAYTEAVNLKLGIPKVTYTGNEIWIHSITWLKLTKAGELTDNMIVCDEVWWLDSGVEGIDWHYGVMGVSRN